MRRRLSRRKARWRLAARVCKILAFAALAVAAVMIFRSANENPPPVAAKAPAKRPSTPETAPQVPVKRPVAPKPAATAPAQNQTVPNSAATPAPEKVAAAATPRQAPAAVKVSPLRSLTFSRAAVEPGGTALGIVTLRDPAGPDGVDLAIRAEVATAVMVPASLHVAAGTGSASFPVTAAADEIASPAWVEVTVSLSDFEVSARLRLVEYSEDKPAPAVAAPKLASFTLETPAVQSGGIVRATVVLDMPAPTGGSVVTLVSSFPSLLRLPPTIRVPEGRTSTKLEAVTEDRLPTSFGTTRLRSAVDVELSASSGGEKRNASLKVQPRLK